MPDYELQWLREELAYSLLLPLPQVPSLTKAKLRGRYLGEAAPELTTAKITKAFLTESIDFQSPFKSKIAAAVGLPCSG